MDNQTLELAKVDSPRELSLNEINAVSGGSWLKLAWRFINLYLLHPSHTDRDPNEH